MKVDYAREVALGQALNHHLHDAERPSDDAVIDTAVKFERFLRTGKTPKAADTTEDAQ